MKQFQFFALISMFFAGLTSVIAKAGLKNVSGDTGLAVRTCFVFVLVWINVFAFNQVRDFNNLAKKDVLLLGLSGLTTTLSWGYLVETSQVLRNSCPVLRNFWAYYVIPSRYYVISGRIT